jgi:copper chaperone CopZ
VPAVRGQLEKVPGVLDVDISLAEGTAEVTVAKGTPPETVAAAVTGRFSATLAKD